MFMEKHQFFLVVLKGCSKRLRMEKVAVTVTSVQRVFIEPSPPLKPGGAVQTSVPISLIKCVQPDTSHDDFVTSFLYFFLSVIHTCHV